MAMSYGEALLLQSSAETSKARHYP